VIVDDGTPTDLEFKGDGVQSLAAVSVIQHYSSQTARAKEFILAIEEPEAHLHPRAIHALRAALRETAAKQQVVMTTHSPLFVNRIQIQSNVIVERTKARPATTVQELRDILGVRAADNLQHAEVVLVVEGPEDELAMRSLVAHRSERLRQALADGTVAIRPLHGGGNLSYVLAELRDSLASVHAFLDCDQAGKVAARAALDEGLLDRPDRTFATLVGAKESEFEDMVDPAVYEETFRDQFGVKVGHPWMNRLGKGKWSSRLAFVVRASGQSWDENDITRYKRAVAQAVADAPGAAIKPDGEFVIAALVEALERKLELRGP
jgi:putative ATP-dependent endonuclease of the OLD family